MSKVITQVLHGNFYGHKGQRVSKDTLIGTGDGWGPGTKMPSHDHRSFAEDNETDTNAKWFNGATNNLKNPYKYLDIKKSPNAKWAFDPSNGYGGYDYLQQTPYNWYTGANKSLHDGIDLYAPQGSKLYAGVNGVITDIGYQENGLTYLYIRLDDATQENNDKLKWHESTKYKDQWWFGNSKSFYHSRWAQFGETWYYFNQYGYALKSGWYKIKTKKNGVWVSVDYYFDDKCKWVEKAKRK